MGINKPSVSPAIPELSIFQRSRLGNSLGELHGVDGRSMIARRYRELCNDLANHLGGEPSATQIAILKRAAALQAWCEQVEGRFANGEELDMAQYTTATNTLRRLANDLGLQRISRDVTPDLSDYLEAVAK